MNTNRLTDGLTKANALYRAGEYRDALKLYKQVALRPEWARLVRANIELCRKKLRLDSLDESPEIVVALTTIRSRLPYLPKVIGSILGQTLRPTRIDFNISREAYLLDEGIDPYNPTLLDLKISL